MYLHLLCPTGQRARTGADVGAGTGECIGEEACVGSGEGNGVGSVASAGEEVVVGAGEGNGVGKGEGAGEGAVEGALSSRFRDNARPARAN